MEESCKGGREWQGLKPTSAKGWFALKHVGKSMGKHLEILELCLICHFYFPTKLSVQKFSRGRSVSDDWEFLGLQRAA